MYQKGKVDSRDKGVLRHKQKNMYYGLKKNHTGMGGGGWGGVIRCMRVMEQMKRHKVRPVSQKRHKKARGKGKERTIKKKGNYGQRLNDFNESTEISSGHFRYDSGELARMKRQRERVGRGKNERER